MIRRVDAWLHTHARGAVRLLLIVQVLGFAFMVAGTNGAFAPQSVPPTTTDFAGFYAAGILADQGMPQAAYDEAAHAASEARAVAPGVEEKRFLNPPVFLLLCAPLARLPYLPAFVLFEVAGFVIWLMLATRIAGGGSLAAMTLAAVPSVWWALGWGQNSFLSASLMAGGTMLLRKHPIIAGAAFGSLCFKPHFGLLIPVALIAGRYWRAILGAALAVAGWGALSIACYGLASWRAFIGMASHARAAIETGIQLAGHVDLAGAARLLGLPAVDGWLLQALLSVGAAACVAWLWAGIPAGRKPPAGSYEAACAGLVAGTLAATPFVLFYDLVMVSLAASWLVRAARRQGWLAGEPAALAALMIIDLLAYPAAATLHLAVGTLVAPAALGLAIRRFISARNAE